MEQDANQYRSNYQNDGNIEESGNLLFHRRKRAGDVKQRLFERTKIEDYHTVFRRPHHVPDSQYKHFVQQGRRGGSGRGQGSFVTKDCCARTCSAFSIVAFAFLFMIGAMVDRQPLYMKGTLPARYVQSQKNSGKFVIQYILPATTTNQQQNANNNYQSSSSGGGNSSSSRLPVARAAYRAGWAYLATALACQYVLHQGWIRSWWYRNSNRYEDIPDGDHPSVIARSSLDAGSNASLLPTFHAATASTPLRRIIPRGDVLDVDDEELASATQAQAYQQHQQGMAILGQLPAQLKHWLAHRGWYKPQPHRNRKLKDPKMV